MGDAVCVCGRSGRCLLRFASLPINVPPAMESDFVALIAPP
jgi:hypothetical protein